MTNRKGRISWNSERDEASIWLHDSVFASIHMEKGESTQEEFEAAVEAVLEVAKKQA